MFIEIRSVVDWVGINGMTDWEGDEDTFWKNTNVLYLVWGGGYMGIQICL